MKLKELANMTMVGVMVVSLATCGGSDTAETTAADVATVAEAETIAATEDAKTKETEALEAPAAGDIAEEDLKIDFVYIDDESEGYIAAHYNGTMETKEKLGLNDDQIIVKWNIPKDGTAKDTVIDLADQGCQVIFVSDFEYESYVIETVGEYPDIQFCHTTSFQTASSGLSSIHNYFTSIYEPCYASGAMVGLRLNQMIEDETVKMDACKIGYVDAYPYVEVISGYTSFFSGAHPACSDATMEVRYTGNWASFSLEEEAADALISDGCVPISQHADATGIPTVCEVAGVFCMGYNISMIATAPKQTLTSASNNRTAYATETIQHVVDGTGIPVDWCEGFSDGAVLIIELNKAAAAPGIKEKVGEVEAKLASGGLHIFDTSAWTVGGETLDTYKKDSSGIEYISGGYFHESEFGSTSASDILIDDIATVDNQDSRCYNFPLEIRGCRSGIVHIWLHFSPQDNAARLNTRNEGWPGERKIRS